MTDCYTRTRSRRTLTLSNTAESITVTYSGTATELVHDIAAHLYKLPRFCGAVAENYSVLHHSVACGLLAKQEGISRDGCSQALLHDAHEMLTGDIPSPVKLFMGDGIKNIEAGFDGALSKLFSPRLWENTARIKKIDSHVCVAEMAVFGISNGNNIAPSREYIEMVEYVLGIPTEYMLSKMFFHGLAYAGLWSWVD